MHSSIIGIIVFILIFLSLIGVYITRTIIWNKSRPFFYIHGVGIRYTFSSQDYWPDLECLILKIKNEIAKHYFLDTKGNISIHEPKWMEDIIIEIIPANGIRTTPTTIVSEATKIAGSIDFERKFPLESNFCTL